jgi:Calcineurin-like phosphoesterase
VIVVALLTKLNFDQSTDHLVFTGDIIFKGPDSSGVIDLVRSYGGSCVRGNHEDRVLLAYASMHGSLAPMVGDQQPSQSPVTKTPTDRSQPKSANAGPSEDAAHGDVRHRALAATLTRDQIEWLNRCPVILNVGRIAPGMADYVVVHAGLAPGVPLDKQDPFQVMNMRTIDLDTRVPTELRQGEPWEKVWNHFQKHALPEQRRKTAVYGHDSKSGLNILKYSKGLDSGCVKGGKLSALVVDLHGKEKVVSVKCSQDYTTAQWKDELEKLEDEGLIPKMGGVS